MNTIKRFIPAAIVCVAIATLIGATIFLITKNNENKTRILDYAYTITEPNQDNGGIGDNVKGNKSAPAVVFEYADFQCGYCAAVNPYVNRAVEKSDGKLAVVYRNYLLDYHQNGTAAASAAEAAALQGYWKEYANKLFSEQSEWASASVSERTILFRQYFNEVTSGKGDLTKFTEDMASSAVSKKISFDMTIGKYIDLSGTPAFYIAGQHINWGSTDGGSITINDQTITWDHSLDYDEFTDLLVKIADAASKKI